MVTKIWVLAVSTSESGVGLPEAVAKGFRGAAGGQEGRWGVEHRVSDTKSSILDGHLRAKP